MQELFISSFDIPLFFAFAAAMQSFIIFFCSADAAPLGLAPLVASCWCGEDADAGALPLVAGASVA